VKNLTVRTNKIPTDIETNSRLYLFNPWIWSLYYTKYDWYNLLGYCPPCEI